MADIRMGPAETQFAEIIWENEPIASGELSKLAEEKLNWKKTTSFTTWLSCTDHLAIMH